MDRRTFLIGSLSVAALATAGCTSGGGATSTQPSGAATAAPGTPSGIVQMTALIQAFQKNFNPFINNPNVPTLAGIYEPLMISNNLKGELVPWLADKYEFSADNLSLTLTLHEGVKWSDGKAFTAKDVAFTFDYVRKNPSVQNSALSAMGEGGFINTVTAKDDKTVVFAFKQPNTPGLYDIIAQMIVPEHVWSSISDPVKATIEKPVGTGPFTELTQFQPQSFQIERNPNYWQPGKPYVQGLRFNAYSANEQQVVAATQGKIDWAGTFIPNVQQAILSKNADMSFWSPASASCTLLELNTTRKPFDDPIVRKAFSMALDRQRMVQVALSGYSKPADVTGLGDSTWKVADPAALGDWTTYNADKANQMLEDAGYKKGADGIRTTPDGKRMSYSLLMVNGFSDWISAGQIMVPNLKAVGIELTQKMIDPGAYFGIHPSGDWDVALWFGYASPTPYDFYRKVLSKSTVAAPGQMSPMANFQRYASPKGDELLAQWAGTADIAKQKEIANELQKVFADEAPVIPLWPAPVYLLASSKSFTGWPSAENPYAFGFPNGALYPEQLIVMTTIKPK